MRNKMQGFTLIELMLVIATIALLSSLALLTYRNHRQYNYVEKAALETQNFMSAALNYVSDTGNWPTAHSNIDNCTSTAPTEDNFMQNYVPNRSALSLFGNYYCWSQLGSNPQLFWLAIKIPHNDVRLSVMLRSKLPNAIITQNPNDPKDPEKPVEKLCESAGTDCFVRVELTNTSSSGATGTYIAGMGNCIAKQNVLGSGPNMECDYVGEIGSEPKPVQYNVSFTCPANRVGNLVAGINFLDVGKADGRPYALRTVTLDPQCVSKTDSNTNANVFCKLIISAARANGESVATGAQGRVGASYAAYCAKPKTEALANFSLTQ